MTRQLHVQLFETEDNQSRIGFRLVADSLPSDAKDKTVDLSRDGSGTCMVAITRLWEHDSHSQGFDPAAQAKYVGRVRNDVLVALAACKGEEQATDMSWTILDGMVGKGAYKGSGTTKPSTLTTTKGKPKKKGTLTKPTSLKSMMNDLCPKSPIIKAPHIYLGNDACIYCGKPKPIKAPKAGVAILTTEKLTAMVKELKGKGVPEIANAITAITIDHCPKSTTGHHFKSVGAGILYQKISSMSPGTCVYCEQEFK